MSKLTKARLEQDEKEWLKAKSDAELADWNGCNYSHDPLDVRLFCQDALMYIERIRELEVENARLLEKIKEHEDADLDRRFESNFNE